MNVTCTRSNGEFSGHYAEIETTDELLLSLYDHLANIFLSYTIEGGVSRDDERYFYPLWLE